MDTPFFVLAPEYVHRKVWFAQLAMRRPEMFYMVPRERYAFVAAHGGRARNTAVPCRHWAREGRCPRGDACPFIHGGGQGGGEAEEQAENEEEEEEEEAADEKEQHMRDVSGGTAASSDGGGRGGSGDGSMGGSGGGGGGGSGSGVVVAPFDCIWHVHVGKGRAKSVVAAWRQKHERRGKGGKAGAAAGAVRLVASAAELPAPPTRPKPGGPQVSY